MKRLLAILIVTLATCTHAQQKGEPGKFDFYLLNVVPSPEFCLIQDVGVDCLSPPGYHLHGLWAQNNNGTYPVFCADRPGPAHPEQDLDLTPDITLLAHEWAKHGTCTTLAADAFFAEERQAFNAFTIPPLLANVRKPLELKTSVILDLFAASNSTYPHGSIILWCTQGKLTSVSACLSKDLKPIACQGVRSCTAEKLTVAPTAAASAAGAPKSLH
jgi:ribonuclease T2